MPNASTDIIIIGAGIAGLAAGCYAQMSGYRTEIFELHDQPGGLCTSWEFHHLWQELGISQTLQFIHHQELIQIRDPSGKNLMLDFQWGNRLLLRVRSHGWHSPYEPV